MRFGAARAITDANGRTTLITRDPFGRVIETSMADGTTVAQTYADCTSTLCTQHDAVLLITRTISNGGAQAAPTERVYLDGLGREVLAETQAFTSSDGWIRVESRYDGFGRLTHRSVPYFSATGTASYVQSYHDVRNRTVREARPDGGITTTQYSGGSGATTVTRTETVIVPGGSNVTRVKRSVFDARGFVTSTTDAYGQSSAVTTAYAYDAQGNLANVTVDGQQVATMQYNAAGHRMQIDEVNTGLTTFTTDPLGRVLTQADANGYTTTFGYDRLNRLTNRVDGYGSSGAVTNSWVWDPVNGVGTLGSRSTSGFSEIYTYNGLGRLTQVQAAVSVSGYPANGTYTTGFGHDAAGRLTSITYAGNGAFTRHYNSRGYLAEVRQGSSVLERITQQDPFGRSKRTEFGNGLVTQYGHDLLGRTTEIQTGPGAAPKSIQDLEYAWRSNGQLHFRRDRHNGASTAWTETFQYDGLDRVTSATTAGAANRVLGFGYDLLGNLTGKTSNVAADLDVTSYGYADAHRLAGATIGGVYTAFNYDAAGNIVQYLPNGGEATQLDYDARGQVAKITVGSPANPSARDEFWYGPDGDRFLKRVTWLEGGVYRNAWVLYLLGGAFEQVHPVGDAAVTYRRQVQITDTVAHRRTVATNGAVTNAIEYLYRDHLGSVDVVTNASGGSISTSAFDPFGGRRAANWTADISSSELATLLGGPSATQHGFTDHEHLDRTGFIHMNGRVYDPRIGRFVQPDPIVQAPGYSQSYNRYAYAFNSPLTFVDPSGFQSEADAAPQSPEFTANPCLSGDSCSEWRYRSLLRYPYLGIEPDGAQLIGAEIYRYWLEHAVPTAASTYRNAGSTVGGTRLDPCAMIGGGDGGTSARGGCYFFHDPDISMETKRNVAVGGLMLMTFGSFAVQSPAMAAMLELGLAPMAISDGMPPGFNVLAGGGARVTNLAFFDALRIQNAVNRTGVPIAVVGSRAGGRAGPLSDWDYVLPAGTPSRVRHSLSGSLPEGPRGIGEPRLQDFFMNPVDTSLPYITFYPVVR